MKTILAHIRGLWRRLLELRDTPHAIAGGLAIGVFWGFMPLFGVKTLLSLLVAWLTRCSKISAVIAVSLHDVVLPFVPFLLRMQYDIGYWIMSHPHQLPPKVALHEVKLHAVFHWATIVNVVKWLTSVHGGLPLLVGSFVVAVAAALIVYVASYAVLRRREMRRLSAGS